MNINIKKIVFMLVGYLLIVVTLSGCIFKESDELPTGIWRCETENFEVEINFEVDPTLEYLNLRDTYGGTYCENNIKNEFAFSLLNLHNAKDNTIGDVWVLYENSDTYIKAPSIFMSTIKYNKKGFYLPLDEYWQKELGVKKLQFEKVK